MLSLLRKAGQKVRAFDDSYAAKLADYIAGFSPKQGSMGQNVQAAAALAAGAPATRKFAVEAENAALRELVGYGVPALNVGVRYGVPLLGAKVISDGVGALYDVASDIPIFPGSQGQEEVDYGLGYGPSTLPM